MSQENVEIVRASFEAWNAKDMDGYHELYDPHAILRLPEDWPEPGPYFGRDAVMRYLREFRSAWDTDGAQPVSDFVDVGDRVAVTFGLHGGARGPEANLNLSIIFTVREGKILAAEAFKDRAEVLGLLGMQE